MPGWPEFNFGLREMLMALVGLVVVYMVIQLVLMHRVRPLPTPLALPQSPIEPAMGAAIANTYGLPDAGGPAWNGKESLAQQVLLSGLERELDQVRQELDALRGELAALREELENQASLNRATQAITPLYGDAMKMAIAGHDAGVISERCGIARAEAELVEALIRNQKAPSGES